MIIRVSIIFTMDCLRSMLTCEPTTIAFRSTGSVPVPVRKGASCAGSGLVLPRGNKKSSLPATLTGPEHNYGVQVNNVKRIIMMNVRIML